MNRLSQEEFEALFDHAAMGMVTVSSTGAIAGINGCALQQFGYERSELIGQQIESLIPQRYRERHHQHRENYFGTNPHQRPMGVGMDLWGLRKDGSEFPVEVSLNTYQTDKGRFAIAFISDITVRKASENALLRLNEELERKVEARTQSLREALDREKELGELKSRFVSMASHEFRTPLSTILSSTYLLSKYEPDDDLKPKRDRHIQRIISCVGMLTDILNDFLSIGKIEEGKIEVHPAPLSLPAWIEELNGELEHILRPGQEIDYSHDGQAEAMMDPSLLKHIIQNLVSNASKFSPEGAAIELKTTLDNEELQLSVKDAGIGISEDDQRHLFERFFRGNNAVNIQGTGLGLHIVGKYAELMNGDIRVESRPGDGTRFTLRFKTTKP